MYKMKFTPLKCESTKTKWFETCKYTGVARTLKLVKAINLRNQQDVNTSALFSTRRGLWIFTVTKLLSSNLAYTTTLCFSSVRICACNKKLLLQGKEAFERVCINLYYKRKKIKRVKLSYDSYYFILFSLVLSYGEVLMTKRSQGRHVVSSRASFTAQPLTATSYQIRCQ